MPHEDTSEIVYLDGARMCIAATVAAIAGFLKERNIPLQEFMDYLGESFEGSFGAMEGAEVKEVMDHLLALEILPMGVEVLSSTSAPDKVEVTLTTLPPADVLGKFGTTPAELLEGFGITEQEYESIYDSYTPAARAIGLVFKHQIRDGKEIISLSKA